MTLPFDFIQMMQEQWGADQAQMLLDGLNKEPCVSVRVNRGKWGSPVGGSLSQSLEADPVPWCAEGFYLPGHPAFTFDPLFHAGAYYVQEASSMFLDDVMRRHMPEGDLRCLDLCAAPGGKSTLLRARLSAGSLLVSNEPVRQRAQVLAENMTKWGDASCVVTNNYPRDFQHLTSAFDVVVVDAPCSGEGMFRKDERAIEEWSLENVKNCVARQREIVSDIWRCLKPGGLLVYSTCTFNRHEDEDNAQWIVDTLGGELLEQRHFLPGRDRGEGFYIAAIRKDGDRECDAPLMGKGTEVEGLSGQYELLKLPAMQCALPIRHAAFIRKLQRTLHVLTAGVATQELKGRDWVPAHALAMSQAYVRGTWQEVSLGYSEAIRYLRRDALRIEAPRGYVLLTYQGLPLGFAKSVGGRLNNMYPQEWRIRTTHTPEVQPHVLR